MKKRILSLVLCAAMLLSMCLFLGAGVMDDTTADGSAETTETVDGVNIVSFTNAGPLVTPEQNVGPAKVRALAANDTGSGVKLDKTVTGPDNAGNYTVRLEAYATGEQTTTVSTKPCDIVLVLDVSGSMDWCIEGGENCSGMHATTDIDTSKTYYVIYRGNYYEVLYCTKTHPNAEHEPGWYYKGYTHKESNRLTPKTDSNPNGTQFYVKEACTSRLSALKTAVGNFIDQVADKETDTVKHNISIVKFAGDSIDTVGNDTYGRRGYNYSQIVKELTDARSEQTELKEAVNTLSAGGATQADFGMQHAQTVLKDARNGATKVVVMFTDGEPTSGSEFESPVANAAISAAKELKAGGATVYTVGCMNGADASRVDDISALSNTDVNKYMHLMSSNYKNATSMSDPGEATYPKDTSESYYLAARNADALKNVFESISHQIGGSKTDLTSTAVLKDAVTPYFEIPDGAQVTLKTAKCTGVDNSGKLTFDTETETDAPPDVEATVNGNTVSVTGFDYKTNWCGPRTNAAGKTTYSGQKLIVEFKIRPTNDFLGGNGVKTNVGTEDGIYESSEAGKEPVERFAPQNVDVPVKAVNPEATDYKIYLGETTNLQERVNTVIPRLNDVNNAYVDVTYTVKDKDGSKVGTYTVKAGASTGTWHWESGSSTVSPEKDTTYTVTSTSTPANPDGTQKAVSSDPVEFKITVNTCSLKITKTVKGKGANPDQTFVFNVKKGNDLVTTVVLKAGASTTITGLAVGDYTVVEDTAWSWSYELVDEENASATLNKDNPNGEVKVTNSVKGTNWLTSIADVINKWTTKDGKTIIDKGGHVPAAKTN